MDKTIEQLGASGSNLLDTDVIEGQTPGSTPTKKYTGQQMRQVEKDEREAQDDVIEASVGLENDGTFPTGDLTDSWHLRTIDFNAGVTDRGGATGALTENVINALRILDASIFTQGSYIVYQGAISVDTSFASIVPAGFMLEYVVFEETAGNEAILDLGTTAGGSQVFIGNIIDASDITVSTVSRVFSFSADTTLYLNDDDAGSDWNSATVNIYFVMRKIQASGSASDSVPILGYYEGAYGFSVLPTDAEISAVLGNASDWTAGAGFLVNDTLGNIYLIISSGSSWFYLGGFGVAV